MPIGDLLASISGGKSAAGPVPSTLSRQNSIPAKRKADGDLRDEAKSARWSTTPTKTTLAPRPATDSRAQPDRLPYSGTSASAPRPVNSRQNSSISRPTTSGNGTTPSRLGDRSNTRPTQSTSNSIPKAPPKKGSFAEILARGQRAQASMGQVGRIQHKKVEKGTIKKDREEPRQPPKPGLKSRSKQNGGYSGTAQSSSQRSISKPGPSAKDNRDRRNGVIAGSQKANMAKKATEQEVQKKVKKAVSATTGYTGTARPVLGKPTRKDASRGGALLNAPPTRPGNKSSRYEDDYDEELDDFIDYDEEEDEDGPRYGYASDASSDMEAGIDDIDGEERRAEFIARREDIEEERMERNLKMAKEDRKRKALETLRANRRR